MNFPLQSPLLLCAFLMIFMLPVSHQNYLLTFHYTSCQCPSSFFQPSLLWGLRFATQMQLARCLCCTFWVKNWGLKEAKNRWEFDLEIGIGSSGSSNISFLEAAVEISPGGWLVRVVSSDAGREQRVFLGSNWSCCVLEVPVLWHGLALPLTVPPFLVSLTSASSAVP